MVFRVVPPCDLLRYFGGKILRLLITKILQDVSPQKAPKRPVRPLINIASIHEFGSHLLGILLFIMH